MKFYSTLAVYVVLGLVLGWGMYKATVSPGGWWILGAVVLAYCIAFAKIGCLPKSGH